MAGHEEAIPVGERSDAPRAPAQSTGARAVADSFFSAIADERWTDAARLLDTVRFGQQFRNRVNSARAALPSPDMTVEGWMRADPEMPRAVAEWQVERMRKAKAQVPGFGDFSFEYAGITSFRMLAALSVTEAGARWLEARDPRFQMREGARRAGCDTALVRQIGASAQSLSEVIAMAHVDDSTAYALFRSARTRSIPEQYRGPPELLTLRRTTTAWRVDPSVPNYSGFSVSSMTGCAGPRPR
jgi:hypothetical protein